MLNNKNDLLDPLTVIIKLFIYSFKNIGTKISIKNNKISIQDNGIFQGTVRKLFNDNKNDINILFMPILFACELYLNNENKQKYKYIFENTIIAFNKLKETYYGNEIIHTIDNLKTNIELFLQNENYDIKNIISNADSPSHNIKQQIFLNINSVWTNERLSILFGYIYEIDNYKTDECLISALHGLDTFIDFIDICTLNIINSLQ